ncbi:RDD family protein [Haladaptatus sp. DJG-WS-42]|uniref:RDD family protein n=1 Tax=Haladaptatus sp. DJG-WS-42 TaxID=3120516 RepID=UPI0030D224CD
MSGYQQPPTRDDSDVIGARIGAQIVDTIIIVMLFFLVFYLFSGFGGLIGGGDEGAVAGFGLIGLFGGFLASFFYGFLLEGVWDGQTIGKRLFGIKVVKENGEACNMGSALVRNLLEIIDGLFYYLVGFIVMAMSDKRQRIGDRLAGTVVVRETPKTKSGSAE